MMPPQPILQTTFELLAKHALPAVDPSMVLAETSLASLNIDSLAMAELLFDLEETFDVEIPMTPAVQDRLMGFAHAQAVADMIQQLVDAKTTAAK